MKSLSLAGIISLFGFCSCALSTDKVEEDGLEGGSIPPPKEQQLVTENISSTAAHETLPEILTTPEPSNTSSKEIDVTQSGGFVFEDALKTLASPNDLNTPTVTSPVIPAPAEDESSLLEKFDKPVVSNP